MLRDLRASVVSGLRVLHLLRVRGEMLNMAQEDTEDTEDTEEIHHGDTEI